MVTVRNLVAYNKGKTQLVLDNVSCSLLPGRITLFIGRSGAGKTTLLKALVGLQSITSGEVLLGEENTGVNQQFASMTDKQRSEAIGYVFQDFNLFLHLTVEENCIDPLMVHGMSRVQAEQRAHEMLEELEMLQYAQKYPADLSGGQQQRVAIARALCLHPKVLLLDEPSASLDPFTTEKLALLLQKLAAQGLTIGLSSQDMSFVRKVFDRVYFIQAGAILEHCDGVDMLEQCALIRSFL